MIAVMERLHHNAISFRSQLGDLPSLSGICRERLFTQHVLADSECSARPPAMKAVGQRVVDRIHIWIGNECLIAIVNAGDAVFGGESLGAIAIAGGHRGHHNLRVIAGRFDERRRCDTCCSQDADPHRGVGSRHVRDASSRRRTLEEIDRALVQLGPNSIHVSEPVALPWHRMLGLPAVSYVDVGTES